ncbi:hypothetical protein [Rhodococcus koreensis]
MSDDTHRRRRRLPHCVRCDRAQRDPNAHGWNVTTEGLVCMRCLVAEQLETNGHPTTGVEREKMVTAVTRDLRDGCTKLLRAAIWLSARRTDGAAALATEIRDAVNAVRDAATAEMLTIAVLELSRRRPGFVERITDLASVRAMESEVDSTDPSWTTPPHRNTP